MTWIATVADGGREHIAIGRDRNRMLAVKDGQCLLRALNAGFPGMEVTRANETMVRAVAVFVGRAV